MRPVLAVLLAAAFLPQAATARTLLVGEGREFPRPSAAIAVAQDGDTVLVDPGSYFDCATIPQNRLVIAGTAPGAVITDRACQGKALLVIDGDEVTVRDLTLARARVPDGNGAGIRLQAPSLTLQHVAFENDQVGLLSASAGGRIRIEDCTFSGGGVPSLSAVMVADSALLRVARSTFEHVAGGQVATTAERTEIIGNTIATSDAPAVLATAGALLLEDNVITVGSAAPSRAAVALWDDATATLRRNRLVNQAGKPLTLLLDWSWGSPALEANLLHPGDTELSTSGIWRHRASSEYRARKADIRSAAGRLKRFVKQFLP